MSEVERILFLIDGSMNYYTLQLGRCAVFSILLLALIMGLRRICGKRVFVRGLLWSLLLLAPFIGKMKAFYEQGPLFLMSWRWITICMSRFWLSRLYFAGMAATAVGLWRQRSRINRFVKSLRVETVAGTRVFVCETMVPPFTTGVLCPKIVVPGKMLEEYQAQELKMILLHEKMHIRLGHLLFYLLWDVLHVLLWVNPLFIVCLKYFKEDMEDICDSVTMRRGESTGYEYGSLLLKSIKLLQSRTSLPDALQFAASQAVNCNLPFAFAGEDEFLRIRERVKTVVGNKGYRPIVVYGMVGIAVLTIGILLADIRGRSYSRYQEMDDISVYDLRGKTQIIEDCGELREAISFDENYLYVNTEKLRPMLVERGAAEEMFVISYGGFYKLPGYGGGGGCEILEWEELGQSDLKLPCSKAEDDLLLWLFKRL